MTTLPGLVTFEQIKKTIISAYNEYEGLDAQDDNEEFDDVEDMEQLINVLDGLGFNGQEAYDFIFDAILIK